MLQWLCVHFFNCLGGAERIRDHLLVLPALDSRPPLLIYDALQACSLALDRSCLPSVPPARAVGRWLAKIVANKLAVEAIHRVCPRLRLEATAGVVGGSMFSFRQTSW